MAVVSMKGGVGKTSVTANLAAVMAQDAEPDSKLKCDIASALSLSYGQRMLPFGIPRDEAISMAFAFQQPLGHYAPDHPAVEQFQGIADWATNIFNDGI
ncbi:cellulose synthase operon protein YhjQ/BcsQ [Undibacterium sp. Ji50W]|uniref:cellulose synthase operon protein YhjQ/BcsQ n=1 Tax=Undibacterium sp. Ji50W TaxID=3413041 RepID=UPI003BF30F93